LVGLLMVLWMVSAPVLSEQIVIAMLMLARCTAPSSAIAAAGWCCSVLAALLVSWSAFVLVMLALLTSAAASSSLAGALGACCSAGLSDGGLDGAGSCMQRAQLAAEAAAACSAAIRRSSFSLLASSSISRSRWPLPCRSVHAPQYHHHQMKMSPT
jgi:hypothetical protein